VKPGDSTGGSKGWGKDGRTWVCRVRGRRAGMSRGGRPGHKTKEVVMAEVVALEIDNGPYGAEMMNVEMEVSWV